MDLPVRLHRADLAPVAVQRPGTRRPVVDQIGEQLVAQVVEAVITRRLRERLQPLQDRLRRHDEDLGGHRGRRGLVHRAPTAGPPFLGSGSARNG
jgi:hypothetical protein